MNIIAISRCFPIFRHISEDIKNFKLLIPKYNDRPRHISFTVSVASRTVSYNKVNNLKLFPLSLLKVLRRGYNGKPLTLKKKVNEIFNQKDIVLYENSNVKFFKYLTFFSVSQFIFWTYLSHVAFTTMRDCPVDQKTEEQGYVNSLKSSGTSADRVPIWRRVNLGKYKDFLAAISVIIGFSAIIMSSLYTMNSVQFIILKKGGEYVTLKFFSVVGKGRSRTMPLTDISAKQSRHSGASYLPLKQKGRKFNFIVDMKGTFHHTELFDRTVGMKRSN